MAITGAYWPVLDQGGFAKNVRAYGIVGNGVVDDTLAFRALVDSFGSTASMRAGCILVPNNCVIKLTDTIEINRKALTILGSGWGSAQQTQGSCFKWAGPAGLSMFKIQQCWGVYLDSLRFIGDSTSKPLAAIDIVTQSADSPRNTQFGLRRIWVGHYSSFDTDAANQFTNGIITSGTNAQGDQSYMEHINVQGVDTYCMRLANPQNVNWRFSNLVLNGGPTAVGFSTASRHSAIYGVNFASNACDVEITNDGGLSIYEMTGEESKKFARAHAGSTFRVYGGYWMSSSAMSTGGTYDENVIDVSAASHVRLTDWFISRGPTYAGTGEKIKLRGSTAVLIASSVGFPAGRTPAQSIDMATTTVGDKRRLEWSGQPSGNFVNEWIHGDAPDFTSTHIDSIKPNAWAAPTLLNGWGNIGGTNETAGYRLTREGMVEVKGMISGGTTTAGTVLFTMPVGFRPLLQQAYPVNAVTEVMCRQNGNVELDNTAVGNINLGLLRWRIG